MGTRADEPRETLDLRALDLRPGEASRFVIEVPDHIVRLGGADYRLSVDGGVASVEATHAHTGWHLRVDAAGTVTGPCWRCLEPASIAVRTQATDFGRFERPAGAAFDEDLDSEYLDGSELDALGLARDGLLDEVPATILCRDECRGLCPRCGANANERECDCVDTEPDPRWNALRDVAARLEADPDTGA